MGTPSSFSSPRNSTERTGPDEARGTGESRQAPGSPAADGSNGYEAHAHEHVRLREQSPTGALVASDWAASLDPGAEVLEIGCGAGIPVSSVLVSAGLKLWAIDASPTLLQIFKSRFPDIPARCEPAESSDFFARTFDAAIAIGLIFLLDESAQRRVIRRVSESLRVGGRFLFTAPVEAGTWRDSVTGLSSLSLGREQYEEALSSGGLHLLRSWQDEGGNHHYDAQKVDTDGLAASPGADRKVPDGRFRRQG